MRRTGLGMDLPGDGHGPTWGGWAPRGRRWLLGLGEGVYYVAWDHQPRTSSCLMCDRRAWSSATAVAGLYSPWGVS